MGRGKSVSVYQLTEGSKQYLSLSSSSGRGLLREFEYFAALIMN